MKPFPWATPNQRLWVRIYDKPWFEAGIEVGRTVVDGRSHIREAWPIHSPTPVLFATQIIEPLYAACEASELWRDT